jgi:hypothetical protein
LAVWKKNERSPGVEPLTALLGPFALKLLMVDDLFRRTGASAIRSTTARFHAIRALSTGISTGFSTAASEN